MPLGRVVRALYAYDKGEPDELALAEDELLVVLPAQTAAEDDPNWLCVQRIAGASAAETGLAPANYVADAEPLGMLRAAYDYTAAEDNELSFREGDCLALLARIDTDWWLVREVNGVSSGLVPANYVLPDDGTSAGDIFTCAAPAAVTLESLGASVAWSDKCQLDGAAFGHIAATSSGHVLFVPGPALDRTSAVSFCHALADVSALDADGPRATLRLRDGREHVLAGLKDVDEARQAMRVAKTVLRTAYTAFAYTAQDADELSVPEGRQVDVLEDSAAGGGWSLVCLDGRTGLVPASYLCDDYVEASPVLSSAAGDASTPSRESAPLPVSVPDVSSPAVAESPSVDTVAPMHPPPAPPLPTRPAAPRSPQETERPPLPTRPADPAVHSPSPPPTITPQEERAPSPPPLPKRPEEAKQRIVKQPSPPPTTQSPQKSPERTIRPPTKAAPTPPPLVVAQVSDRDIQSRAMSILAAGRETHERLSQPPTAKSPPHKEEAQTRETHTPRRMPNLLDDGPPVSLPPPPAKAPAAPTEAPRPKAAANPWAGVKLRRAATPSREGTAAAPRAAPSRPAAASSSSKPAPADTRLWRSRSGVHTTEAAFVSLEGAGEDAAVVLLKLNGVRIRVQMRDLCERDVEFAFRRAGRSPPAALLNGDMSTADTPTRARGFDWRAFLTAQAGLSVSAAEALARQLEARGLGEQWLDALDRGRLVAAGLSFSSLAEPAAIMGAVNARKIARLEVSGQAAIIARTSEPRPVGSSQLQAAPKPQALARPKEAPTPNGVQTLNGVARNRHADDCAELRYDVRGEDVPDETPRRRVADIPTMQPANKVTSVHIAPQPLVYASGESTYGPGLQSMHAAALAQHAQIAHAAGPATTTTHVYMSRSTTNTQAATVSTTSASHAAFGAPQRTSAEVMHPHVYGQAARPPAPPAQHYAPHPTQPQYIAPPTDKYAVFGGHDVSPAPHPNHGHPQPYGGHPPAAPYGGHPGAPYGSPHATPYGGPPGAPYGGPHSAPYGGPPNPQYGGPPSQPYGGPYSAQYGGPPNPPYGAPIPNAHYGAPIPNAQYGVQPPNAQYGVQPPNAHYGAQPPNAQHSQQLVPHSGQSGQPPYGPYPPYNGQ